MQPSPSSSPAAYCGLRGSRRGICVGTGSHAEDPVTEVRGADGASGYAVPSDVTQPERGQVPEYRSPQGSRRLACGSSHPADVPHVLDEHIAGSKFANDAPHLEPQSGLGVLEPVALPGARRALAGEAPGDEVNRLGRSLLSAT